MSDGGRVHLLEKDGGEPAVLLHGTGNSAGFLLPLLDELHGVHAMAPDLPGVGLSGPIDLPRDRYRQTAVAWLDRLLDALELDSTALVGHSGGGLWALWYALAHPDQVTRLVLLAPPALPGTRCPLPIRLVATPVVGELLSRLAPPSRKSVLRLARFMGEGASIAGHPDLVDLLVAVGRTRPPTGPPRRSSAPWSRRSHCCRRRGSGAVPSCGPRSCARWPCPRWWSGESGTRSAAFRSPRR